MLEELRLADVRSLVTAHLCLAPGLNLITGANGAGKTSLLEAVHLLARGRSFRTRYTVELIRDGSERLWVAGRVRDDPERRLDVQCERSGTVSARIDGVAVDSLAALTRALPVQVLDPGIHRLVEEGPQRRRRWLDWIVFHVEPGFGEQWQRYSRALRQRNAALRAGLDVAPWDAELAPAGEQLTAARDRVLVALQGTWQAVLTRLGLDAVALGFSPGWPREEALAQLLARHQAADRESATTRLGPHRFDVRLRVAGRPAREVISRGQQKLLGAAMILAAAEHVVRASGRAPLLLLDDPAAELDAPHTQALLTAAADIGGQRLVTALRPEELSLAGVDRVFHVERGTVKRL